MPTSLTDLDIANQALRQFGDDAILTFPETTTRRGQIIDEFYETVRDATLQAHPWSFALVRAVLTANATVPVWGYTKTMTLPADCLRIWRVGEAESLEYSVEGQTIVTDATSLSIRYIRRVTSPLEFSPLFVEAFVAHLAAEVAEPITGQAGKGDRAWQKYAGLLRQARLLDGTEGSGERRIINMALRHFGDEANATFPDSSTRRGQIVEDHYVTVRDATLQAHPWNFAIVRTTLYAYTEPAATLTPGATTGTGITFTASAAVFAATDVGKVLKPESGIGRATITAFTGPTQVVATITEAFASVAAIAAGAWRLYNAPPTWGFAWTITLPSDCLRVWRVDESAEYQVEGRNIVTDEEALSLRYIKRVTDTTQFTPLFIKAFVSHLAAETAELVTGQIGKGDRAWQKYQGFLRQARTMDGMEGSAERIRSSTLIDVRHSG